MKLLLTAIVSLAAMAAAPAYANAELAAAKNCMACHAIDKKMVGPGFKEVAAKYAGDKSMEAKLAAKIKNGGGGVWGQLAMPPNAVSEQEAATLAKWVLSLK